MDTKEIFSVLKRWTWLIVLGLVLGAASGLLASKIQKPVYEATSKVLVFSASAQTTSDVAYLSSYQIAQTFADFLTTQPVMEEAALRVGSPIDPKNVEVELINNTQIVKVTVVDGDPQICAQMANTLVVAAIERFAELQSRPYIARDESIQSQLSFIEDQVADLQDQIVQVSDERLQRQIEQLEAQILPMREEVLALRQEVAVLTPAYTLDQKTRSAKAQARLDEIEPLLSLYEETYANLVVLKNPIEGSGSDDYRLTQLNTTLGIYQELYANLSNSLERVRQLQLQNASNLVQIEPAVTPEKPLRPIPLLNTVLAAAAGVIVCMAIGFLIHSLDDILRYPSDVKSKLDLPVIGTIGIMPKHKPGSGDVLTASDLGSPIAEDFRTLKANVSFAGQDKPLRSLLVTSTDQLEGKSTVAANLAVTFSQSGRKVLLIDADMRRPAQHKFLNLRISKGLMQILSKNLDPKGAIRNWRRARNMQVITSGGVAKNPMELLGSSAMENILTGFESDYDTVIIDTPPCLVSDAFVLSGKVDGVLLVVQPGRTHVERAKRMLEQFNMAGANVVGVIVNRYSPGNDPLGNGHYAYRYGGYPSAQKKQGKSPLWKNVEKFFKGKKVVK